MTPFRPRVLISNGFNRFYLAHLAAALRQRQWDIELLTGAYPTGVGAAVLRHLPGVGTYRAGRLEDRRVDIEPGRVHPDFTSEIIYRAGAFLGSRGAKRLGWAVEEGGFRLAGARASRRLKQAGRLDAYHVRGSFGLSSLRSARRRGIPIVCDHSFVHPAAIRPLLQHAGTLPAGGPRGPLSGLERLMAHDLRWADWIVVNSDFVRDTFEWAGFDMRRVRVVYAGVEPEFVASIPAREEVPPGGPLRLLFAGEVGQRKGADVLFRALTSLDGVDWRLDLVGSFTADIASAWREFLEDPRVTCHESVRVRDLAGVMSRADVFVFPSLAEGSARVVAMAMAAGCFVVTTRNSGSIVQDGIHGRVVPPGKDGVLGAVLGELATQRGPVASIGRANADLIRREYLLDHYTDRIDAFYREILGGRGTGSAS